MIDASDDDDSDEFAPVYDDQFDGSEKQWVDHELEPLDDPRTPDVVDDLASRLITDGGYTYCVSTW